MKPISIAFQCFGPYLDRQFIDFSLLEKDGIFLICGETGAGKTTILEAMSYALYGKATGGNRGDLQHMRYEFAPPHEKTEVEFIFECSGTVYRFYRAMIPKVKKQRKKKTEQGERENDNIIPGEFDLLFESQKRTGDGKWISVWEGSKKGQNKEAAKSVIGLDHSQFCQIVILPQGKFETFLVSDSGDKEKILKSIFRTQRWENAALAIKKAAEEEEDAVKEQGAFIKGGLEKYGCETTDKLSELLTTSREMEEEAKEKAEAAKALHAAKQAEVGLAERTADDFEELEEANKKLQELLDLVEEKQEEAERLDQAERAEALRQVYDHYRDTQKEKEKREQAYARAIEAMKAAEEKIQKAEEALKQHEAGAAQIQNKRETLESYKGKRELYSSLETLKKEGEKAKADLAAAKKEADKSAREFEKADRAAQLAKEEREEAYEAWSLAQEKYLRGIGSVLAQSRLTQGQPCPVCGSLHHPNPAKPAEDHVSDEELKEYEENRDRKQRKEREALDALNKKREEKEKKQGEFTVAERNAENGEKRLQEAQDRCIAHIPDSEKLEEEIRALSQEIEAFDQEETELHREKARLEGEKNAAAQALEKEEKGKAEAIALWEQVKTQWQEQCEDEGFADEAAYLAASMEPEEKNRLTKSHARYMGDLRNAELAYYTKARELEGKDKPNLPELKKSLQTQLDLYTKQNSTYTGLHKANEEMEEALERFRELEQDTKEREEKAQRLKEFGKKLLGSHGIGIQRYILGIMLSSVIQEANRILQRACDGRYTIYRTDEGRGKVGLELGVYTYGMGDGRLVKTLSGGEKFLVSLCLAIGMSTVIQARGSGRMDALFVDEGFGSLDADRINEAIGILLDVRGKNGMVGVISHVESMIKNIHTKIRIQKTKNGSSLEIET